MQVQYVSLKRLVAVMLRCKYEAESSEWTPTFRWGSVNSRGPGVDDGQP